MHNSPKNSISVSSEAEINNITYDRPYLYYKKLVKMIEPFRTYIDFLRQNYNEGYPWRRVLVRKNATFHRIDRKKCINIMKADWDNLIVLDACRTDLFEETVDTTIFDTYGHRTSLGSLTPEWAKHNFEGQQFSDTVYVTGNPWISRISRDSFYDLVEVWSGSFDESLWTVRADSVYDAALEHYQADKRLVAHFMQPHPPFIREFEGSVKRVLELDLAHWQPDRIVDDSDEEVYNVWHALGRGEIGYDSVWKAYKENLEYVFEYAMDLAKNLTGKTVITSDHGIVMGERLRPIPIKAYGHPYGIRHKRLTEVPWAVFNGERRNTSVSEYKKEREGIDNKTVRERLRKLGYAE